MKASQTMQLLAQLIAKYGDQEVHCPFLDDNAPIRSISFTGDGTGNKFFLISGFEGYGNDDN